MIAFTFLVLLLATAGQPPRTQEFPISERDSLALEITIPPGWTIARHARGPRFRDHRHIVIAVNNGKDDSLHVGLLRKKAGGGTQYSFGPESFERQLKPGTIYVDVAYQVGGPHLTSVPYAWTREETPSVAVAAARDTRSEAFSTRKVVVHQARFVHWGRTWEPFVAARKPYSKRDLEQALSILESLRFPDLPVEDPRQAAEVAIPALPADFRKEFEYDPKCGCCRDYTVDAIPSDAGYHVTFNLMDAQTRRPIRSMSVDVDRQGRATLR